MNSEEPKSVSPASLHANEAESIFDHVAALKQVPHKPGVYLMYDRRYTIVYIGKAIDLRKRVGQYFSGQDPRFFVSLLPGILSKIDVIITSNEKEALILEAELIKRHKPRYNVFLRDDKAMLQLRIDLEKPWPRFEIIRKRKKDKARYFGPFPNALACRQTLSIIHKYFHVRNCSDAYFKQRKRPCMQYEIHRCSAPCVLEVDRADYLERCRLAVLFLDGKYEPLLTELETKMHGASRELAYERAASYRDQIQAIKHVFERQRIVQAKAVSQDYFALVRKDHDVAIACMIVREGRLVSFASHVVRDANDEGDATVLMQVMLRHYMMGYTFGKEVLLPIYMKQLVPLISETLSELSQTSHKIRCPQRGPKAKLLASTFENAEQQLNEYLHKQDDVDLEQLLQKVQRRLGLKRYPHRIECYDISNLQGTHIVSAMVVFVAGEHDKARSRQFKMKSVKEQDDFASMSETIARRCRYLSKDFQETTDLSAAEQHFAEFPDLMIIDGGKGQLSAAMSAIDAAGLRGRFDVIAMAEGRKIRGSYTDEVLYAPEKFYFPQRTEALILEQRSDVNLFLQRVRDATHDAAVGFHQRSRQKAGLKSRITEVPGIGAKRKAQLLRRYGSARQIAAQDPLDIARELGISEALARKLIEHLNA